MQSDLASTQYKHPIRQRVKLDTSHRAGSQFSGLSGFYGDNFPVFHKTLDGFQFYIPTILHGLFEQTDDGISAPEGLIDAAAYRDHSRMIQALKCGKIPGFRSLAITMVKRPSSRLRQALCGALTNWWTR